VRTIKRRKKGKTYLYLQHSIRQGSTILTKEVYLGKHMPGDIDERKQLLAKKMLKEQLKEFEPLRREFQTYWQALPKSVREDQLKKLSVAFTYNTNAIEGSTITLSETSDILTHKTSVRKPITDVTETRQHAAAFLEMVETKRISQEELLRWHATIFSSTKPDIAGKYRDYLVRVGEYRGIDWQDIEAEMSKLMQYLQRTSDHPIEMAARSHFRFEKIHPFGDGNGRVGRLLMNWVLWKNGYPMLIIEYKKRKAYYKALSRDETYFLQYTLRTYKKAHRRHR